MNEFDDESEYVGPVERKTESVKDRIEFLKNFDWSPEENVLDGKSMSMLPPTKLDAFDGKTRVNQNHFFSNY
jgi:hypothetical protein